MTNRFSIKIIYVLGILSVFNTVSFGAENDDSNRSPYYLHNRDMGNTTMVSEGKSKHFSTTLNLDKKNGDLTLVVEATGDEIVEFNLDYNFKSYKFYEKISGHYYCSINNSKPNENIKQFLDPFPVDATEVLGPYIPRSSEQKYKSRGIMQMYKSDTYSSKGKIWNMKIWDQLVEELEKDNNAVYNISNILVIKVGDEFYWSYTPLIIDYKTMRAMKGVQQRLARNPPEVSKETYREMKIIATDNGENESTILLDHKNNHDH